MVPNDVLERSVKRDLFFLSAEQPFSDHSVQPVSKELTHHPPRQSNRVNFRQKVKDKKMGDRIFKEDPWGQDPSLQVMRRVLRRLETDQNHFWTRLGISRLDHRLRS